MTSFFIQNNPETVICIHQTAECIIITGIIKHSLNASRTAKFGISFERSAPDDKSIFLRAFNNAFFVDMDIWIQTPFPNIAVHIINTPVVGLLFANRLRMINFVQRIPGNFSQIPASSGFSGDFCSIVQCRTASGTAGIFPLDTGGGEMLQIPSDQAFYSSNHKNLLP